MNNITGPQTRCLWAIAVSEPIEMEIQCQTYKSVKTLQLPLTMVTLEPTYSAFSSKSKLPPYFRQYPNGFNVALTAANLHVPKFTSSSFRIWNHFNISNLPVPVTRKLQRLPPTPSVSVDHLKNKFRDIKIWMKIKMINLGFTLLEVDQVWSHPAYCNRCDCVLVFQETPVQRW